MGKKIFVTYKYGDTNVKALKEDFAEFVLPTKARDYVTELDEILSSTNNIYKGEKDNQPLNVQKTAIQTKLKEKIYDSSITIVVISPNMKDPLKLEKDQWIPWEISYSLCNYSRNGITSKTNALLAIVLPDRLGSYNYFIEDGNCCQKGCRILKTDFLFKILKMNMFNQKSPDKTICIRGDATYSGYSSYIYSVKWCDFKSNPDKYLNIAIGISDNITDYNITKTVN